MPGLWPIAHLKKIEDREGQFAGLGITVLAELHFGDTEGVVGIGKNFEYSPERVQAARKTAATAAQNRDVVPQVGVDAFNGEGIVLVVNISHVLAGVHHVDIAPKAVGAVILGLRRGVD